MTDAPLAALAREHTPERAAFVAAAIAWADYCEAILEGRE